MSVWLVETTWKSLISVPNMPFKNARSNQQSIVGNHQLKERFIFDEEAEYDIISGNKALKTIKVDAGAEEALVKKLYGISASVNVTTE